MKYISHIIVSSLIVCSLSSCNNDLGGGTYLDGEYAIDLSSMAGRELNETFGPAWKYTISISFKDTEGNDLVAPLAEEQWSNNPDASHWAGYINPDKLHLDVIYSNPPDWFDNTTYTHKAYPGMIPDVHVKYCTAVQFDQPDSPWYVVHGEATYINTWGDEVRDLTFKLSCPTIFGDDEIHEFVTYWEEGEEKRGEKRLAKCTKVVFEGQEYIPKKMVIVHHYDYPEYPHALEGKDVEYVHYAIDIVLD